MRATRPKHSLLSPLQRKKANARSYINVYIKRGAILPQPCQVCGASPAEKHHEDYNKPLEVIWLCRPHHLEYHAKKGD